MMLMSMMMMMIVLMMIIVLMMMMEMTPDVGDQSRFAVATQRIAQVVGQLRAHVCTRGACAGVVYVLRECVVACAQVLLSQCFLSLGCLCLFLFFFSSSLSLSLSMSLPFPALLSLLSSLLSLAPLPPVPLSSVVSPLSFIPV